MARWTIEWLRTRGITTGHVIDWGCGEGTAAAVFAAAGWRVTGVDRSDQMLSLARQHHRQIDWRKGDLRDTRLDQTGTLATAFYDTLNYLTTLVDLQAAWRTLADSIRSEGHVIADVNTPYEYASAWDGRYTITADREDVLVLNRLRYNPDTGIATGRIIWFATSDGETWQRGSEMHLQRAHTDGEMCQAIDQAGLTLIDRTTPQGDPPSATSTRVIYIARKVRSPRIHANTR